MNESSDRILNALRTEMQQAIGWESNDGSTELQAARATALSYYKGKPNDMPSVKGRSRAFDNSLADIIEQLLPNITEIFLDENVAAFRPRSEADISAAEQETDFVNHVFFKQNDGFILLHNAFKDAFLTKTGYWVWYWEAGKDEVQEFKNHTQLDVENAVAALSAQNADGVIEDFEANEDGTFNYVIRKPVEGKVCIRNWQPEDVAVSEDTMKLGDGTYCGFRARVRRGQLLIDGYDAEKVAELPAYSDSQTETNMARDTAGESSKWSYATQGSDENMETVEIIYHYLRIKEGKEMKLHYIVSGGGNDDATTILSDEIVERVDAAAITPFPIPHRFYGLSMADKLLEPVRQKTSMLRIAMDSSYFAMSPRHIVIEDQATKYTYSDLLDNSPGSPIRAKTGTAVTPVQPAQMAFDPYRVLEYLATQVEQRSGVLRSSAGLNSDTLHETAGGMLAMKSAADQRLRFIARNFAETGVKELFIGIHDCLRRNATMSQLVKLRGKWVPVNPAHWSLRDDMDIEIGNDGGKDKDISNLSNILDMQTKAVQAQGGLTGPLMDPKYLLYTSKRLVERSGINNPEMYFPDPEQYQPAPPPAPEDPMQSPEAMKVMAELNQRSQIEQAKIQAQAANDAAKLQASSAQSQQDLAFQIQKAEQEYQLEVQKAQAELELQQHKLNNDKEIAILKIQADMTSKSNQLSEEIDFKKQFAEMETQLQLVKLQLEAENHKLDLSVQQNIADLDRAVSLDPMGIVGDIRLGGEPG